MSRFYYYPEFLRNGEAETLREVLRAKYPELPPWIGTLRPETAKAHNEAHIERLKAESRDRIDYSRARSILRRVQAHPIACLEALPHFDRSQRIGLCYGRAYAALLEARQRGISERSMRKFFIIGDLSGKTSLWNFHSVTAVAGKNPEGWWVIDPHLAEPVLPSEWVRQFTRVLARDVDDIALFFATSPKQMTRDPHSTVEQALASPIVGRFFHELLRSYDVSVP